MSHEMISEFTIDNEFDFADQLFDELFPICRSIAGPGFRQSLSILKNHVPIKVQSVKTGTHVHDWMVPQEWIINSARLVGPDGKIYADFKESNLHVVNYSSPIDIKIHKTELQKHIHTIPSLPSAIPYVTSYYARNWGFCISHDTWKQMPDGIYHAYIDSKFIDGELNFADAILHGESNREFLLSTYLCHPSLANNELSGPLVWTLLFNRLKKWNKRRYTYRFVMVPETIGSISYLSIHGDKLKNNLAGGLVLTCLGGKNKDLSFKTSRRGNSLIDQTVKHLMMNNHHFRVREFTPTGGSDERQYCSAGYNLPVGQFARDVYADYDGYHNSLDTKDFMRIEQIEKVLKTFELAGEFINQSPYGEPQLGKRGLYPNINSHHTWSASSDTQIDGREYLNIMLNILNYSDGENNMIKIAERCHRSVLELKPIIEKLENEGLLKIKGNEK